MLVMMRWFVLAAAGLWVMPGIASTVVLQKVRISGLKQTRLVFEFNHKPTYTVSTLTEPQRVVMDFSDALWEGALPKVPAGNTQLRAIRSGKYRNHVRMVLDLKQAVVSDAFALPPTSQAAHRVVLDLMPQNYGKAKSVKAAAPSVSTSGLPEPTMMHVLSNQRRDVVVVIDPGHGGKDPGATGLWGTREKDVVLGIAKALQKNINARKGYKAVLTRNKDIFLPLRKRLSVARSVTPDMFVSIHADAFDRRSAAGASVYALSEHGASNEAAKWLADSENAEPLVGGVSLDDKGNVLRSVLLDLSQHATIMSSLKLGKRLLAELNRVTRLHRRKVDQAAFVVLKSPDIPSVLVESGFLSNPKEEERLRNPVQQRQFALALAKGIVSYFKAYAPHDSYIAWLQRQPK